MSPYKQFIFKRYEFNKDSGELNLYYGYDDVLEFIESYHFDFKFVDYNEVALDRAVQLLFFIAGVSYYKAFIAPEIIVLSGNIDEYLGSFLNKTYQKGLGEFFYVNNLNPNTTISFPVNSSNLEKISFEGLEGQLIGLGGGKDSLVSVELLREQSKIATWSLNHKSQLEPLVQSVGLNHLWVERTWDSQLADLKDKGALNGHVPISAIFSAVGSIVCILSGFRDAVVSNESSASEPSLTHQGVEINHQYSKSLEYEKDFQMVLERSFSASLRYYSFLRPFSELRIAEIFSKIGFDKYLGVFSSCNRAYRNGEHSMFWCGECAKCAFVCLILLPFVEPTKLFSLWGGRNLVLEQSLEGTFRQLLGIEGNKPLDCVGEVKEARTAMQLAQQIYPELVKYQFDIPDNYDFRSWSTQSMPNEIFNILETKLSN